MLSHVSFPWLSRLTGIRRQKTHIIVQPSFPSARQRLGEPSVYAASTPTETNLSFRSAEMHQSSRSVGSLRLPSCHIGISLSTSVLATFHPAHIIMNFRPWKIKTRLIYRKMPLRKIEKSKNAGRGSCQNEKDVTRSARQRQ